MDWKLVSWASLAARSDANFRKYSEKEGASPDAVAEGEFNHIVEVPTLYA